MKKNRGKEIWKKMTFEKIDYEKKGRICRIRMKADIKDRHGFSRLTDEIAEAATAIAFEDDIWVVVLTGAGTLTFSKDKSFVSHLSEPGDMEAAIHGSMAESVANIEKPVIVEIDGDVLGQGLELILACDIRIASERSRFGMPHLDYGLIPCDGGTQRLPRLVGKGKALEMILTGKTLNAVEAQRIGLMNKVVSRHALRETVMQMAQEMASKSPMAMQYAKEAINKGMDLTQDQGLRLEADLYMLLHTCRDRTEGIKAFQEKRKPRFTGD
jgi:enoyl-CoA hydratase/carnithine racemase